MAQVKTLDLCREEMFTSKEELLQRYDEKRVEHLMRLREMYNWCLQTPSEPDRRIIDRYMGKYGVCQSKAYADLAVIKQLLPALASASREFHRNRCSEMLLETYNMAKRRQDVKAMVMAANAYGKLNRVDLEDEKELPFELIVIQPFTPSSDPTLLGLKPIPNVEEVKAQLRKRLSADIPDIEDVDYEPADLEEETLFPEVTNGNES